MSDPSVDERMLDLEVKLAYQERLIRELDALVRTFGERLDLTTRELETIKRSLGDEERIAEKPPHY